MTAKNFNWLVFSLITMVVVFWSTIGYIAFHFISKWW